MIVSIENLIEEVKSTFPELTLEVFKEKEFFEIKIYGENNNVCYFYPNDDAWFVKLYPTHSAYMNYLFAEVRNHLFLN